MHECINKKGFSETLNDEEIQRVWEKGITVEDVDADLFRHDAAGAWIARDCYGNLESIYGWEIDHIYPLSRGGDNQMDNLRPMNWRNNKSKKNDYPYYKAVVTSQGSENIERISSCTVNKIIQEKLRKLYSK